MVEIKRIKGVVIIMEKMIEVVRIRKMGEIMVMIMGSGVVKKD